MPCVHSSFWQVRSLRARVALVPIALLAVSPALSKQEVTLPSTKPGQLIGELIKLCDAAPAEMTRWLTTNAPSAAVFAQASSDSCRLDGGLRLQRIIASDASAITVAVSGKSSNIWYKLALRITPDGKASLGYQPMLPAEDSLPKDLSDVAIRNNLRRFVSQLGKADRFSGIIVVARGRKEIVDVSAGYANRSSHSPITAHTQFTLASIGKMFTATGILQLVDAHKLSLNDTVGKFFPEYPNTTVREKVTVAMLLAHTAGLDGWHRTREIMKGGFRRAAQLMPLYDREAPTFEPGTSRVYSNAGFALAGAILEKASDEDYPDYLRRNIFAPARMIESNPNNVPHRGVDMVIPYTHFTPRGTSRDWQEAPADLGTPDGGVISTADDLVRFADALRNGTILREATFEDMTRNHDPVAGGPGYGYGVSVDDVYGSTVVGSNGGYAGVSTEIQMFLKAPYTIVVLANEDPPAEAYVSERAVALVAAKIKRERSVALHLTVPLNGIRTQQQSVGRRIARSPQA